MLLKHLLRTSFVCASLWLAPALPHLALAADQPPADWMPAGIDQLARNASSHTDFTFDKNMLQLSSGLIDGGDPDTRSAIAKLNGITIHLYHYAQPGMYDPRQLDAIRAQYHAAGWKHMVGTHNPAPAAGPNAPAPTAPGANALNGTPFNIPGCPIAYRSLHQVPGSGCGWDGAGAGHSAQPECGRTERRSQPARSAPSPRTLRHSQVGWRWFHSGGQLVVSQQ